MQKWAVAGRAFFRLWNKYANIRLSTRSLSWRSQPVIPGVCGIWLQFWNHSHEIAKKLHISAAILKEGSPSCGVNFVYDGSFNGNKVKGKGITTEMLNEIGIKTLSEKDLEVNSVNVWFF